MKLQKESIDKKALLDKIRLDVKNVNIEIPTDVHFQNEVQTIKVEQVKYARKTSEIDHVFLAYISSKGHQFERKGRADKIATYLLELLADFFGVFDTDAKKIVLYHENKPKFDRLLDKALTKYAEKRARAKQRNIQGSDIMAPQKHNALLEYMKENSKDGVTLRGGIIIRKDSNWLYSQLPISDTNDTTNWDSFYPQNA